MGSGTFADCRPIRERAARSIPKEGGTHLPHGAMEGGGCHPEGGRVPQTIPPPAKAVIRRSRIPAFVEVEGECAALAFLEIAPDRPQMAIGNLKPLTKVERFRESLRMA